MENWCIGQPVVCVDDSGCKCGAEGCGGENLGIEKDKIYKIKELDKAYAGLPTEYVIIIVGDKSGFHIRAGGKSTRFRPIRHDLAEGEATDFIRLLNANRSKQPVPAKTVPMLPYFGGPKL
jgi:hypothetical protein